MSNKIEQDYLAISGRKFWQTVSICVRGLEVGNVLSNMKLAEIYQKKSQNGFKLILKEYSSFYAPAFSHKKISTKLHTYFVITNLYK